MTDGKKSLEERLERLESGYTYHEQTESQLSRQIFEHDKRIDRLETRLDAIISQLKSLNEGKSAIMSANEMPPHY